MSSKFIHASAAAPCPICGKPKDCRWQNDGNILAYCYTADGTAAIDGFKFIGESQGSSAYKWVQLSGERTEANRRAYAERAAARDAAEAARLAQNATVPQRNARYRAEASQYGLSAHHAELLAARGFSAEDRRRWLHYSRNFRDGAAIVAPIFDYDDNAIGAQIRRDTKLGSESRYRWIEGGGKQKLPDTKELPLAWCKPAAIEHRAIVATEGTSFKPQLTAQRLHAITIGAAGGNFGVSSQQFRRYLRTARERYSLSRLEIAPDSGTPKNRGVMNRWQRAVAIARSEGFDVSVIWYGQTAKASGQDPDEIDAEALIEAERIAWEAFEKIAIEHGGIAAPKPATEGTILERWQSSHPEASIVIATDRAFAEAAAAADCSAILVKDLASAIEGKYPARTVAAEVAAAIPPKSHVTVAIGQDTRQQSRLTNQLAWALKKAGHIIKIGYTAEVIEQAKTFDLWRGLQLGTLSRRPDRTITRDELVNGKYLPDIEAPKGCKLLGLKALHGTGKTEQYARIAEKRRQTAGTWLPVIYPSHRVQLAINGGGRLGIDHATTIAEAGTNPATTGYSLCIDSLKSEDFRSQSIFRAEDWHNAIVVLDEIEQLLQHLLFASTLRSKRIEIMGNFAQLIRNVAASQHGLIVIGDADLSDMSIALLQALSGGLLTDSNTHIIEAEAPTRAARVAHIYDDRESLIDALETAIANGEKVILHTSAQQAKSKWSSINLEKHLLEKFAGLGVSIVRIDSDTVRTPDHLAYGGVSKINELCARFDVVIASPVIETGVSIDEFGTPAEDRITSVWSIASGLQAEQSARQTIERVRSDAPRHIFAPTGTGLGQIGNGAVSPYFVAIGEQNKAAAADTLASYRAAATADSAEDTRAYMDAWANYAAYINAGKKDYRATIERNLRASGYQIVSAAATPRKAEIGDRMDEIKEASWDAKNIAVQAAAALDDDAAMRLDNKDQRTPTEDCELRKYKLGKRYAIEPDDVTAALDRADDESCYPKLQLHYWLTVGREQLSERDEMRRYTRRKRDRVAWLPDANKELLKGKIEALESLPVAAVLSACIAEPDRTWHKYSAELIELRERYIVDRHRLNDVLGMEIAGKSLDNPLAIARAILGKLGIEFAAPDDGTPKQVRIDGERIRQYVARLEFAEQFGDRAEQFERWHAAEAERIAEWHESRAEAERIEAERNAAARRAEVAIEPDRIEPAPAEVAPKVARAIAFYRAKVSGAIAKGWDLDWWHGQIAARAGIAIEQFKAAIALEPLAT